LRVCLLDRIHKIFFYIFSLGFDQDTGFIDNLENSIMNNNSVVNGYDYLTNSFPKETPPLDKDRILGIAKSSGLENPDFTSAVNF
jgi:hypothetical protein